MAEQKRQVRPEIFDPVKESWDDYRMGDLRIRLRFVPTVMGRVFNEDGSPRFTAEDLPEVQVTGNLTISVMKEGDR